MPSLMKHCMSRLLFVCCLGGVGVGLPRPVWPQSQGAGITYQFKDQDITLMPRTDVVAVELRPSRPPSADSVRPESSESALDGGTSSDGVALERRRLRQQTRSIGVGVRPLNSNYALIDVPRGTRGLSAPAVTRQLPLRSQPGAATLPVLSRPGRNEAIVLPNELLITLRSGHALDAVLKQYDLALIRPLRFTQNRYLVRSRTAAGLQVLSVAQRLNQAPEFRSAVPNFLQTVLEPAGAIAPSTPRGTSLPPLVGPPGKTGYLFPYQWHLDSRPRLGQQAQRTDIRAPEAWQRSRRDGKGVVVAIIDGLIQWDHPDLAKSLYRPKRVDNPLPNEQQGWDFVGDDPNTRLERSERQWLTRVFRDSFNLKNSQLLTTYPQGSHFRRRCRQRTNRPALVRCLRRSMRRSVASEFHGTWAAGVVAARPPSSQGVFGVAPKAKILPVRVLGLGGSVSGAALAEAIRYAAARGADVINLSLGGYLPSTAVTEALEDIHADHPHLVVVAAAGNENLAQVSYPAADAGVVAVGATTLAGHRSPYSNFGKGLDVVAPGGDLATGDGIITTGGTHQTAFWQGITPPEEWGGFAVDSYGQYTQVEGTSFAAPMVAGTVALMLGDDRQRQLRRSQVTDILFRTASYGGLQAGNPEQARRWYGHGLINAAKAVAETQRLLKQRQ